MNQVKHWLVAFRLRTLPLSLSCIIVGSSLAYFHQAFDWSIFILAVVTTTLLQVLSNIANDYGDMLKGTDNEERVGPKRALQSGAISPKQTKFAIILTAGLSLLAGLVLIYLAFNTYSFSVIGIFVFLGLAAIAAAIKYTIGKNPYGYSGMGDLFVFIFFGLVGVIGTYFLYTKSFSILLLFPATTIGLLSAAVLNMNNMRDVENDRACNKNTLVVKIGFNNAKYYQTALILGAFINLTLTFVLFELPTLSSIAFIPFIFLISNIKTTWQTTVNATLDPELKKVALSTFFISLLLAISIIV